MARIWQYPPPPPRSRERLDLIWFLFALLIYFCHKIYWKYIYRTIKVAECGRQRSQVKTLLLHDPAAPLLCLSFTWQIVKTRVIRLRVIEGPNARDQSAFCAYTCPNECGPHTYDACIITTWRLGGRAPLVARKKMVSRKPELEAWGLCGIQCLP